MADLGCSSGPNSTFSAVSEITSIIYKRCCQLGLSAPEFRVFVNDLPRNDFDTAFQSLTAFQEKLREDNGPGHLGLGQGTLRVSLALPTEGFSHQKPCISCTLVRAFVGFLRSVYLFLWEMHCLSHAHF
ncbi:SAM dependent carboxyl methyltransferase - like 6 [Theobroma cacao]|nr:SAM dependent carboxyl methyltransferase - like 6 [Theobroma cacao]